MIREETPAGLIHPEWCAGRRLWIDGAMSELIRKLHFGDPVRGWEGDPRLAVYWNPPRWEIMRLEADGEYRMVCRSQPHVPFDERLIDALVAHDRTRRGVEFLADDIERINEQLEHERRAAHHEHIAEEIAPRLRHALREEL